MRISFINRGKAAKPRRKRKVGAKQLQKERIRRWVLKQKQHDYDTFIRNHAKEIAEIRKYYPDWELPRPI